MVDLNRLSQRNAERWSRAVLNRDFSGVAQRLCAARKRYQTITAMSGVPWWAIAVIHEREASQNWNANIAQGDPWNAKSVHIPRGRGPFTSFEAAAVDALVSCAPFAAKWKDWSAGGALTLLEQYNGLGYANRGLPSPYIWSGTDQYVSGKYVSDGMFDPNAVDKQLGCAGLLMAMRKIDSSIEFMGEPARSALRPAQIPPPPDIPKPAQPVPQPAPSGLFAAVLAILRALFQRR